MLEGNGPYGHYAIRNTIVIRTSIFIFLDFPYIFAQFRSNIVREISKIIANVLTCKNPELRKCHRRIRISLLSKANHVIIYRCNISVIICTTQKLNRSTLSILIVFFFFFFFFISDERSSDQPYSYLYKREFQKIFWNCSYIATIQTFVRFSIYSIIELKTQLFAKIAAEHKRRCFGQKQPTTISRRGAQKPQQTSVDHRPHYHIALLIKLW